MTDTLDKSTISENTCYFDAARRVQVIAENKQGRDQLQYWDDQIAAMTVPDANPWDLLRDMSHEYLHSTMLSSG